MKQKIIDYFETDRDFTNGKALYGQLPGRSIAFNNALNRMTNTPANCEKLYYELAKLAGITERHVGIMLRKPVTKKEQIVKNLPKDESGSNSGTGTGPKGDQSEKNILDIVSFDTKEVKELLKILKEHNITAVETPTFEKGLPGMHQRRAFVKANEIEVVGKKQTDFDTAINAWVKPQIIELISSRQKEAAVQLFDKSTSLDKQSVKLHDQFPFLSEDDCPDVYKILVADMVTAYRKYKEAHVRLFEELTAQERLEAAKDVMVPYKKNKAIWAELEHYQETRKSLAKHPTVKAYQRKLDIKAMNAAELAKLQKNITNNINRNKTALEKLDGDQAKRKTVLINDQEEELLFVETELKTR